MSNGISEGYRPLTADELAIFGADYDLAWMDPELPLRQYRRVVQGELEKWRIGEDVLPYRIALDLLRQIPIKNPTLLDVGAASGYYREVLALRHYKCQYTGMDFSDSFRSLALKLFPGIDFDTGDCHALPYADNSFDVLLHSAVIMHTREYKLAIREAARVATRYVLFHRTPITTGPTAYYAKTAYDVPVLEVHFNEDELMGLFARNQLGLIHSEQLFWSESERYGHRSYLLSKEPLFHHQV